MKKFIALFFVLPLILMSFTACSETPALSSNESTSSSESSLISDSQSSSAPEGTYDYSGIFIPSDIKDGEKLENGDFFISEVKIESYEDCVNFLSTYKNNANEKLSFFRNGEYDGFIERDHDSYFFLKRNKNYQQTVFYFDFGVVSETLTEYDESGNIKFEKHSSTEADFENYYYYEGNTVRYEKIMNDGSCEDKRTYEIVTLADGGSQRNVIYAYYKGYEREFTYADKENQILSTMAVTEPSGKHYVWYLDGAGNKLSNVLYIEITQNGATSTYYAGSIPLWEGFVTPEDNALYSM